MTYWAESTVQDLKSTDDEERRKKVYLEARLGAKALVTGRLGGGATNRVYQLSTLQFRGCLEDIAYYGKSRQVSDLCQDLLEAIAALVEFDGLETTTDPSPRSSLTLSMYNPKKATYVERLLSERVVPFSKKLFNSFDPDIRQRCETYVASTLSKRSSYYQQRIASRRRQQHSQSITTKLANIMCIRVFSIYFRLGNRRLRPRRPSRVSRIS